ncbi:MAG: hypothetical protein HQM10_04150 [Candidatus Riflebacteria bacterium]|nr:hypothetical protein [Candidatus Riflebacteria bacterium]
MNSRTLIAVFALLIAVGSLCPLFAWGNSYPQAGYSVQLFQSAYNELQDARYVIANSRNYWQRMDAVYQINSARSYIYSLPQKVYNSFGGDDLLRKADRAKSNLLVADWDDSVRIIDRMLSRISRNINSLSYYNAPQRNNYNNTFSTGFTSAVVGALISWRLW